MLQQIWFGLGIGTGYAYLTLDRSSDHLGQMLPTYVALLSVMVLLIGSKFSGLDFLRDMVIPVELGVLWVANQPLPGMASTSLVLGLWLGLANRWIAKPVTVASLIGQSVMILSPWLLLWQHCGASPKWVLVGLAGYVVLSNRPSGRRVFA